MALSGTTAFQMTGEKLCIDSLQVLSRYAADVTNTTADAAEVDMTCRIASALLKHQQNLGGFLYKKSTAYLIPTPGQLTYGLSSIGDNCTEQYAITSTSTSIANGSNTLTVDSTVGMAANDTIMVWDGSTWFTDTIDSVTNDTTVVMDNNLTVDISTDARIYSFAEKIEAPLRVYAAAKRLHADDGTFSDISIDVGSYDDYQTKITQKTQLGEPLSVAYLPTIPSGTFLVYGDNNNPDRIILFTIQKKVETITQGTDDIEMPEGWYLALTFMVAFYLSFHFEMPADMRADLSNAAQFLWKQVFDNDMESSDMKIVPRNR